MLEFTVPVIAGLSGLSGSILGVYYQSKVEQRRERRNNIYRPLYDEVDKIVRSKELPYNNESGEFRSIWYDFDGYQHRLVEDHIGGRMRILENQMNALNEFTLIVRSLVEDMPDSPLSITRNGQKFIIILKSDKNHTDNILVEARDWVRLFAPALVYAESPEELREELVKKSKKERVSFFKHFESWENEKLEALWGVIEVAESRWTWGARETTTESVNWTVDHARGIRDDLEKLAL